MRHHPHATLALATGLLLALAGCGGGSDGPTADADPFAAGSQVPKSALSSPAGFTAFVGGLTASESDDPRGLGAIEPPTSEDAEAADL